MLKVLNEMIFKGYLEEIRETKPYTATLYRQCHLSGSPDLKASFRFVMIGDLAKWCSLKLSNCKN